MIATAHAIDKLLKLMPGVTKDRALETLLYYWDKGAHWDSFNEHGIESECRKFGNFILIARSGVFITIYSEKTNRKRSSWNE